jgi:hypothetical protein
MACANDVGDPCETGETADPTDPMAVPRTRDDLVGKRFLLAAQPGGPAGGAKQKASRAADWPWKAGLIRCASHLDATDPDLQVGHDLLLSLVKLLKRGTVVGRHAHFYLFE